MLYKKYTFGDTDLYYTQSDDFGAGLLLYPAGCDIGDVSALSPDSMVQVALRGSHNLIDYTQGVTMRNTSSVLLKIVSQKADGAGVVTRLSDGQGNDYVHTLLFDAETNVCSVCVEYANNTGKEQVLESLQSFSVSGIRNPALERVTDEGLRLVRMTSAWSRECRLKEDELCDLGMDMSWARYGVKCERFGQVGSMPNRGYFPFAALTDGAGGFTLAALLEAPYSWQIELYKEKETCALSGGLADREFGHWCKAIPAGGGFKTHNAYLRVRRGTVQDACNDFVRFQNSRLSAPESEESLPVLFNEYCTTWGVPSEENIRAILRAAKGLPFRYFVIDAGWYKPDDCGWCNATGDWQPSRTLFPHGVKAVADMIRAQGMTPGVWFEFEVAGRDSRAFRKEELLLSRDGVPLTTKNRRFFDLRKPEVQAYIQEKMCGFLREYGFGYLKIDYNDNYGMGCDGAESLGEAGRQVAECSLAWLGRLREQIPDLVIENCSSGGSRIEPLRMQKVSMCSFSDAHECDEIPLVAANVSRVIPARQNQIWAVLREQDTPARIEWSLAAAMIGRICISGDILHLTKEQRAALSAGLAFYEDVKEIVAEGDIAQILCTVRYYRDPQGYQVYKKRSRDGRRMLVIAHFFRGQEELVRCETAGFALKASYGSLPCREEAGALLLGGAEMRAGAFLLELAE